MVLKIYIFIIDHYQYVFLNKFISHQAQLILFDSNCLFKIVMGQHSCNCTDNNKQYNKFSKCALLHQGLLNKFEIPSTNNISQITAVDSLLPINSNKLPEQYIELMLALCNQNKKYNDIYFSPQSIIVEGREIFKWRRISDVQNSQIKQYSQNKSKFSLIFSFLQKNYPIFCETIKPIYVKEVGFAICYYYVTGVKTEVIVDDYIPMEYSDSSIQQWIKIFQKGLAKLLGSYDYINQLSVGQIFTEVTGIPYYMSGPQENKENLQIHSQFYGKTLQNTQKNSFNSFKDALKCDQLLFKSRRFSNDTSVFGYRQNFKLSSVSFSSKKNAPHIIKFQIPYKQKISLRLCQQNNKLKSLKQGDDPNRYGKIYFQVFKLETCKTNRNIAKQFFGSQKRFSNYLYVNDIFTEMPAGKYGVYIENLQKNCQLSLIAYGFTNIKFSEVFDQKICREFLPLFFNKQKTLQTQNCKQINTKMFKAEQIGSIISIQFSQRNYTEAQFQKQGLFKLGTKLNKILKANQQQYFQSLFVQIQNKNSLNNLFLFQS